MKSMVLVWWVDKTERCVATVFMDLMMNLVRQKFITDQGMIGLRGLGICLGNTDKFKKSLGIWIWNMMCCVWLVLGDHIGAVRFYCKEPLWNPNRIYREEIPKWQEIIGNNMIFIMQRLMIQNITLVLA